MEATKNKAENVETKKVSRKDLAAELGELVIQRTKLEIQLKRSELLKQLNRVADRCNQLATQIENLPQGEKNATR